MEDGSGDGLLSLTDSRQGTLIASLFTSLAFPSPKPQQRQALAIGG